MPEDTGYAQNIIFPACSGASKKSRLSNRTNVEPSKEGCGRMLGGKCC